jgi:hypothetical protein
VGVGGILQGFKFGIRRIKMIMHDPEYIREKDVFYFTFEEDNLVLNSWADAGALRENMVDNFKKALDHYYQMKTKGLFK